jgi:hypothetical protein
MTKDELRLECLKLAHAHGREPQEVVARAKEYEAYVSTDPTPETPAKGTLKLDPKPGTPGRK